MLQVKAKLKVAKGAYRIDVRGRLALTFAERSAPAQAQLDSGEAVALALPPGEVLRGGDLVTASDGRVIEIAARPEKLVRLDGNATVLMRAAYSLGSAHVPVEFKEGHARVAEGSAAPDLLRDLGVTTSVLEAPFEPEVRPHAGAHDHGHVHDEHCGRAHHHPHGHHH
jgi:urease accessory protein